MSDAAEQFRPGDSRTLTDVSSAFVGWEIAEDDQAWLKAQLDEQWQVWETLFATPAAQLEGNEIFDPIWR
jgi:hypothetical protein